MNQVPPLSVVGEAGSEASVEAVVALFPGLHAQLVSLAVRKAGRKPCKWYRQ